MPLHTERTPESVMGRFVSKGDSGLVSCCTVHCVHTVHAISHSVVCRSCALYNRVLISLPLSPASSSRSCGLLGSCFCLFGIWGNEPGLSWTFSCHYQARNRFRGTNPLIGAE